MFGWSRGGGAHTNPALPAEGSALASSLASFGFTTNRNALTQRQTIGVTGQGYENIGPNQPTFERITIDGREHLALFTNPASTPYVPYSNAIDNAAWTKSDCTVEFVESGGVGDEGYSIVTATADNATFSIPITDASAMRTALFRGRAPTANVGAVKISQDNGSTQTTLAKGPIQEITIAAATTTDPTIHCEIASSGDSVVVYDYQGQRGAYPAKWQRPKGATLAATPADWINKSVSVATFDFEIVFSTPATFIEQHLFHGWNSSNGRRTADIYLQANGYIGFYSQIADGNIWYFKANIKALAASSVYKMRLVVDSGVFQFYVDDILVDSATPTDLPTTADLLTLGSNIYGSATLGPSIVAVKDISGTIFGTAGATWNPQAYAAFNRTILPG